MRYPDYERATQARRHAVARPGWRSQSHAMCRMCLPSPTRGATRTPPRVILMSRRDPAPTGPCGTRPGMLVSVSLRPRPRRRRHDRLYASRCAHALLGAAPLREIRVWDSCETACCCRPIRCAFAHRRRVSRTRSTAGRRIMRRGGAARAERPLDSSRATMRNVSRLATARSLALETA